MLQLNFNTQLRIERGYNGTASVHYGPLLFSLKIGQLFKTLRQCVLLFLSASHRRRPGCGLVCARAHKALGSPSPGTRYAFQSKDLQVTATTPWNYALVLADDDNPTASLKLHKNGPPGPIPFSPDNVPLSISAYARQLPQWGVEHDAAAPPPSNPTTSSPLVPVTLVPHGTTDLRIAELPTVRE